MKGLSFFNKVVFVINVLVALLLLMTGLISLLPFKFISALSVFSLVVPFLFGLNFLFLLFWAFKKNKRLLLSLVSIVICYLIFGPFYGFGQSEISSNNSSDLKIMSFNVWGFNRYGWINEPDIADRIIAFIKKGNPDILMIQEHNRTKRRELEQFPYYSITPPKAERATQGIFSKFPIINSGSLDLPDTRNNIIYVDIVFHTDTVRVYNMHLQSFSIIPSTDNFSDGEKSEKTYNKLVETFSKQLEQAKILREHVSGSPYHNIIGGDLNNTQFSNVYKIIKGSYMDTFLEEGNGFGRTYNLWKFPIRIDYILADPEFEVLSHQNFDVKLSDHYPIMATLRLPSHE